MALSESWIDRIHARMLVRYGVAWMRMWEGIDPGAVKADWAEELDGFAINPDAIKHALDHLPPDRPPNAAQFKALCMTAPRFAPKALPAPKADPAVVAAAMARIKPPPGRDPKAWAHELRSREERGDRLTITQKTMWRAALRHAVISEAE